MKKITREKQAKKVRLVKDIISYNLAYGNILSEKQITAICEWLGFNDTSFRDKNQKEKLNDFLLDEEYWRNKELPTESEWCECEKPFSCPSNVKDCIFNGKNEEMCPLHAYRMGKRPKQGKPSGKPSNIEKWLATRGKRAKNSFVGTKQDLK